MTRIGLVFAIFALVYTILRFPGGPATIPRYFVKIGWFWIMVIVLEAFGTFLDAIAIRAFTSPEQHKVKLRHTLLAQLAGRAINVVTPTGNLGEVVKMSVMTEYVSQSRAVSTILLYNIVRFVVELGFVALAAPFCALLVPMPDALRWLIIAAGVVCLAISIGLWVLVRRGMLSSLARVVVALKFFLLWLSDVLRLRAAYMKLRGKPYQRPARAELRSLSKARQAEWTDKLQAIDDKLRLVNGARARDRWLGIVAITLSQMTSMAISLSILVVLGESLTLGFIGAYIVGGFAIYNLAIIVPMGLGLSEGGWYSLLRVMGESPARIAAAVTMVMARRVTVIMYAGIGLVLVTASETVKRAKLKQAERAAMPEPPVAVAIMVPPPVTPPPTPPTADATTADATE